MASQALSSWLEVVRILHILEMFCFHHSSHLWVASTLHHESESIPIGYPFRALSSRPWVFNLIYDLDSSIAFRALSSRPWVVLLIYDPESFFPFKTLSSRPRVVFLIYDLESFFPFRALSSQLKAVFIIYDPESFLFHLEPWAHDLESFFSYMT